MRIDECYHFKYKFSDEIGFNLKYKKYMNRIHYRSYKQIECYKILESFYERFSVERVVTNLVSVINNQESYINMLNDLLNRKEEKVTYDDVMALLIEREMIIKN